MNLHRADTKPQWESDDSAAKRNIFQKVAAATHGIVTPGNLVSVAGAALVASGYVDIAKGKYRKGVAKVGVGRLFDLLDGAVAEKTRTKSPLGEATDVIIDKGELLIGLPLFIAKGIVPKLFGVAAVAQTGANGYYTKMAKDAGNEIHTTREGKYSTLLQWTALGAYGLSAIMRESHADPHGADMVERGADLIAGTSVVLGAMSVFGYRRDAFDESAQRPIKDVQLPPVQ